MATIQIKRRTSPGTGPLTGVSGTIKAGEPLVDFNGEHLYIARTNKTGSTSTPLSTSDYLAFPSTGKVNDQIDSKITALNLGTAATKNTGTSSGCVPVLNSSGKLSDSVIPRVALTNTFVVSSESAMLALSTAQEGDVAVRTDLNKSFILKASGYSTLSNWQELLTPTDKVQSVNGKTGTVTITLSELSGVDTTTYNTHVASNLHLTSTQRAKLSDLYNTKIESLDGVNYLSDKTSWQNSIIDDALCMYLNVNNEYDATKLVYHLGINKDKVLQPTSVIDGGTY
jgi:hypothetical protein